MSKGSQISASFGASAGSRSSGTEATITAGVLFTRSAVSDDGHCNRSAAVSSTRITGQSASPKSSPV